ncbi:DUF3887 domain-containing protein [Myxococcota bacterium]|nr:DUF3887 domain-containing protein [Myxococcota bacterium]MBU1379786.1 DUF3887 domain-containing protein [Myxococcota bacterium]MBU1498502.1 DUF3887 domain-containing protein [Myxococcota bacterium]
MRVPSIILLITAVFLAGCSKKETEKDKNPAPKTVKPDNKKAVKSDDPKTVKIPQRRDLTDKSKELVNLYLEGKYEDVSKLLDKKVQSMLTVEKMKSGWDSVKKDLGKFKQISGVTIVDKGTFRRYLVHAEFEKIKMDFKVAWNLDEKVIGFFLSPRPVEYKNFKDASYVKKDAFKRELVLVNKGKKWELTGELTIPAGKGPFPAAVLVHGSGPNDLDESIGPNKVFRDIAYGLSSMGIAVLRYNKRTKLHGLAVTKEAKFTLEEETVDDAVSAAELLKIDKRIDAKKIFIIGHSLGAYAMPLIAQKSDAAGFVMMAGNARPIEDLSLQQVKYLASLKKELTSEEHAKIKEIEQQLRYVKSKELNEKSPSTKLPFGIGRPYYWMHLRKYDPIKTLKTVKKPVLILQGERDYQVTFKEDFAIWKKEFGKSKNVIFKSYPALNHLFIEGKGKPSPEEYMKPSNVFEGVIKDTAAFILKGKL